MRYELTLGHKFTPLIVCVNLHSNVSAFWPLKVIDFDTNRTRVCDFLLVRYSNLGPILLRFEDVACFFVK